MKEKKIKEKEIGKIVGSLITTNKDKKIILGIDPGLQVLGIGIIEIDPDIFTTLEINQKKQIKAQTLIPLINQYTHLFLKIKKNSETTEKLYCIYKTINNLITTHNPDIIIVEDSFVGINKNSAIKIGLTRGSILTAIGKHKKSVILIPPKQIKMELTEKGTATKEDVEAFFQENLHNWEKSEKLDSTDALATAFCGIKYFIDLQTHTKTTT